jgi:hypothetical protein
MTMRHIRQELRAMTISCPHNPVAAGSLAPARRSRLRGFISFR